MTLANDDHSFFESLFFEELEKYFTAEIVCCDHCYDDFVNQWPAIALRELRFRMARIDLELVYSGSRLFELYSKDEYHDLVKQIDCPRCCSPLTYNIWPYTFPFDRPKDFEKYAKEMAVISRETPFLVLTHHFAQEVFQTIKGLAKTIPETAVDQSYFRGRSDRLKSPTASDFGPPPPEKTTEGRYNHAGMPVLYLASDLDTCLWELGMASTNKYIAEITLQTPLKILDLTSPENTNLESKNKLSALVYSSLMSAPRTTRTTKGWNQPQYIFSRFAADCAKASGFNAIKYPTVRACRGHNLVILSSNATTELMRIESIMVYNNCSALPSTTVFTNAGHGASPQASYGR